MHMQLLNDARASLLPHARLKNTGHKPEPFIVTLCSGLMNDAHSPGRVIHELLMLDANGLSSWIQLVTKAALFGQDANG